ncbi:MAG: hypothetical protein IPO27_02540 [Bacteroidetes bacterium]|nr:hypothetical protein [Bacteroidota bacterium]
MKYLVYLLVLLTVIVCACKKDKIITDRGAKLGFSTDTILFDTVFVTFGSTNSQLIVYNKNDQPINVSSIRLASGSSSYYRINVDGMPGASFRDIEIAANDSLFIFIEVTIDPNSAQLPFVVADSILFETNGNLQDVDLVAWGQNARFIRADQNIPGLPPISVIPCNGNVAVWDSVLPYVIFGYAVVDSGCMLEIKEGTKVYLYNNSGLWVYRDATLKVMGTREHPVKFRGTRLESYYNDKPGQWDRIWINEGSVNNEINYAEIKNGFIGLQLENLILNGISDTSIAKKIVVNNTEIKNMSGANVFTRYYDATFNNCVFGSTASYGCAITFGGTYEFNHCTFANYWSFGQRIDPLLYISNYFEDETKAVFDFELNKALFRNCIIYGNNESEVKIDIKSSATSNYLFDHCILKVKSDFDITNATHFTNVFKNTEPQFKDPNDGNFELDTMANAKNKASNISCPALYPMLQFDRNGTDRCIYLPADLGAYERKD